MAPADNKNKKHINDIVTGAYNGVHNFVINNKGILINYGLGVAQIAAGAKGFKYAKELNQPLLYLGCYALVIRGYLDFMIGGVRTGINIVLNSYVKDKIRRGGIPPEKRKEEIESMKMYKNNEVLTPAKGIKVFIGVTKEVYSYATSKPSNNHSS